MILRDTWNSGPMAALHPRLGWTTWMSLLFALAFSGICAIARVNGDQIVAWLLSQGVGGEAETITLHGMITNGAAVAGILGLDGPVAPAPFPQSGGNKGEPCHRALGLTGVGLPISAAGGPKVCAGPPLTHPDFSRGKRGLIRGLGHRLRTVVLFLDETIITEAPAWRAARAP